MKPIPKKYDVIVIGELNVDLILDQLESFPVIGKEKLAKGMTFTLGSSSAIFASNISRLGSRVAFIGKIGNDLFGQFILNNLQHKGIDTQFIIQKDELVTGVTIGMNFSEDRAMLTYPGAMEDLHFEDINVDILDQAKHLHISSYFFQPGLRKNIADLFRIAREKGLTTSFDIQTDPHEIWDADLKSILPYVDIFLPNENELLSLTGQPTIEAAIEYIKEYVNILAVKLGSKGSMCYYNNCITYQPAFLHDQTIDAIGAGDSFDVGFIYQFLKNTPLEQCQIFANYTGSYSTRASGGTNAFEDIDTFFNCIDKLTPPIA